MATTVGTCWTEERQKNEGAGLKPAPSPLVLHEPSTRTVAQACGTCTVSSNIVSEGRPRFSVEPMPRALTLSNECAAKAGLRRDQQAEALPTHEIVQPNGERLVQLRDTVTFSSEKLDRPQGLS